jgi:hypothetical protein
MGLWGVGGGQKIIYVMLPYFKLISHISEQVVFRNSTGKLDLKNEISGS